MVKQKLALAFLNGRNDAVITFTRINPEKRLNIDLLGSGRMT